MGRPRRVRDALTLALVPALAAHPALGGLTAVAWVVSARHDRRATDPRLLVPIAAAAVVTVAHAAEQPVQLAWLAGLGLVGWIVSAWRGSFDRRDAGLLGAGASATAAVLALIAGADAFVTGFGQVHPGASHPNVAAGLGLALVGASGAATRLPRGGVLISTAGVVAGLAFVLLTGSRGGWIGIGIGIVVLSVATILGRTPLHGGRTATAATLVLTAVLVGGVQTVAFSPGVLVPRPDAALVTTGTSIDPGRGGSTTDRIASLVDPWRATGGRVAAWTVARQLAAERPWLGYGFAEAIPTFRSRATASLMVATHHPHNGALLILLQGGAVLLTAAALLAVGWLWALARRAAAGDGSATIALAAATALLAADRFDQVLVVGNVSAIALIAALAVLAPRSEGDERATLRLAGYRSSR